MIELLNTSCFIYQSNKDEMVSKKSIKFLEQNPCIHIKRLENSGHYYYDELDWAFLISEFNNMLNSIN